MSKNNVTSLIKSKSSLESNSASSISLADVKMAINAWRAAKTKQNEKIPANIWDQVFVLVETMSKSRVLSALSITNAQFDTEKQSRCPMESSLELKDWPNDEEVEFCEASPSSAIPLAYKPAKAFTTTTSVVELYRPDGMLMKIHLCTDRFEELLSAFFKG